MAFNQNNSNEPIEKVAVISGSWVTGQKNPNGVYADGDLQQRFNTFLLVHRGKVIDWNVVQQSHSMDYAIFVRYRA